MTEAELQAQLDAVYNLRCQVDALRLRHEEEKALAIPPDVLLLLRTIDARYDVQHEEAQAQLAAAEAAVKLAVTQYGNTVKTQHLQAVYMKGRVTWNPEALDGYALAHPELYAFRTEKDPTVQLRTVK